MTEMTMEKNVQEQIAELVARGRQAMAQIADYNQEQANTLVQAAAWAIYKQEHAEEMAALSVRDTGLGKYEDKVKKNQRKTLGTLRDLMLPEAKSVGVINVDEEKGLIEIAKPVGVVGAICPSTNPGATPANKAMMALKGLNAVILAPSPKGASTCEKYLEYLYAEFDKIGAPHDLVQMIPIPVSKEKTGELMKQVDFIALTGSAKNIQMAQTSGTPNVCVSAGNVVTVIDDTADLKDAAHKVMLSKIFDHATSCSSDNAIVIEESVYDDMLAALVSEGGYLCNMEEKNALQAAMWDVETGKRKGSTTAKAAVEIAQAAGFDSEEAKQAKFFMVEETGYGKGYPFSDEKLAVVLTVYKAKDFAEALDITEGILRHKGRGHSCGLHTKNEEHILEIGKRMDVCRLLINQAQCFGNGGSFDNGLNFTLSMGGGTWAGNNIKDNLSYKHFIQITKVAKLIPEVVPTDSDLFGSYWDKFGK